MEMEPLQVSVGFLDSWLEYRMRQVDLRGYVWQ